MAFLYRGPTSPREEQSLPSSYTNPLSPQRNPNRLSGGMIPSNNTSNDIRSGLTRRFTTNALPTTLSPIGQQRKQAAGDYTSSGYARKNPSESTARAYEALLNKQREIQAQLANFDSETKRSVEEGWRHSEAISQMIASSEPASPPEYANAFPNAFSRPSRYSAQSLTSPQGLTNRPGRSSTQLTSPSSAFVRPYTSGNAHIPSQSVPGSRRHSDDEEEDDAFHYGFDSAIHRAAANPNRNSMPVTGYDRKRNAADFSLGPVNTTSFLFDDDEDPAPLQSKSTTTSPPNRKQFLQMQQTADGFPKLISRDEDASSAALDLALARGVEPQPQVTDRATASRHRISLPPTALSNNVNIAPLNSILANADGKSAANNRRSMEVKFSSEAKRPSLMTSPPQGTAANGTPKPMSSYSTNDIPTLKNMNGEANGQNPFTSPTQATRGGDTTSEQASKILSRNNSISNNDIRASQEFSSPTRSQPHENNDAFNRLSGLHANAAPFGPIPNGQENQMPNFGNPMSPYAQQPFYGGYNMPMLNNGFGNLNLNGAYAPQGPWPNQMNMFGQQGGYGGYQQFGQGGPTVAGAGRFPDNNQRMTAEARRQAQEAALQKYAQTDIRDLVGEIYMLCKDQHGCRFLQRKLDERDEPTIQTIFNEVKDHIIELMTDPFGNYLCQKLLESTNDEQRTVLIRNAMPAMTKIALNQHGTRALQKMIEFISTPEQTNMIIDALRYDVVQLIQDLNGNHVIQKCLNHLSSEDAQFIFDAVGANCVTVGTHRHGCCVLQRCIDHASGLQKGNLVDQVIQNAFSLVQDPFGNYVVQYILDLGEPSFTEPLCKSFKGNVVFLSKQKFSSNVVEKCIRCAGAETKHLLIAEIVAPSELEKLLRDSFANYVVQTAMDFADEDTKPVLMGNIRPMVPAIRSTPYGRRIQTKLAEYDQRVASAAPSGATTPAEIQMSPTNGVNPSVINNVQISSPNGADNFAYSSTQSPPSGRRNRSGWVGPSPQWGGNSAFANGGFGNGALANGNFAPNGNGPFSPNHADGAMSPTNGFTNHAHANGEIASPTPQRHGRGNSIFAADAGGFGSPTFGQQPPTFGRF
ncbi:hypothetical protein NU219Hw_g5721t1 [Hortaea werneckii]